MTQPNSKPPSPRRCDRILQAHYLDCQGRSLDQIAAQLDCARSTVAAYLHDLRIHYHHILQTAAAGQLLHHVELLSEPDQDPACHQRRVATARELRLILTALPRLRSDHSQPGPKDDETAAAIALARSRNRSAGPDGHARHDNGRCAYNCPRCKPEIYEEAEAKALLPFTYKDIFPVDDPDTSGIIEENDVESAQNDETSGQIWTNLDESGLDPADSPANHAISTDQDQLIIPPPEPKPPTGPRYPYHWEHNPDGYPPRANAESPLVRKVFGQPPPRGSPRYR